MLYTQEYNFNNFYLIAKICKQIFWPIDRTLTSTSTPGQIRSASDDNEGTAPHPLDFQN